MNSAHVKPEETGFIMAHALRTCRSKIWKKGTTFSNNKLTNDETEMFANCLGKYIDASDFSSEALRNSVFDTLHIQ